MILRKIWKELDAFRSKGCAGRLLRDSSASFSPLQFVLALPDCVGMLSVHDFGLPAFSRFPQFSAVAQK